MIKEIKEIKEFWIKFEFFYPQKLSKSKDQLITYGNKELMQLLIHYGSSITDVFQGYEKHIEPDINADNMKAEWSGFKYPVFQKRLAHYHTIDTKISAVKIPAAEGNESVLQVKKERNSFSPKMLWSHFQMIWSRIHIHI